MSTTTTTTTARFSPRGVTPETYQAMQKLTRSVTLDQTLLDLIFVRVSQINGCAFCLEMHTREAREHGEPEQRLYALDAWREWPLFTERERAALALAEAVTLLQRGHVPDQVYDEAARHFDQPELANVIWAATVINSWNRVAISARSLPGTPT